MDAVVAFLTLTAGIVALAARRPGWATALFGLAAAILLLG